MFNVAIACVVKNEEQDLGEWIAFHLAIGIKTILIYDNESSDQTRNVIMKFTTKHDVRLIQWNLSSASYQRQAFLDAANRLKTQVDWVAFIDADEFIMSDNPLETLKFLEEFPPHVSQISLSWAVFGSSGHVEPSMNLVIEDFQYRAHPGCGINRHVKSIVRPSHVIRCLNPHTFAVTGSTVDVNGNEIIWSSKEGVGLIDGEPIYEIAWINHYLTKSATQWSKKIARGYHDISVDRRGHNDLLAFDKDCTVRDDRASNMVENVKQILGVKTMKIHEDLIKRIWRNLDPYKSVNIDEYELDIQGWGSKHEYLTNSVEVLSPKIVIEIGVWKGGSTISMAKRASDLNLDCAIISVDTWLGAWDHWLSDDFFGELGYGEGKITLFHKFLSNVKKLDLHNYVVPLALDSTNANVFLRSLGITADLIHIDAGHDYQSVMNDISIWWNVLRPGGVLIGDDYDVGGGWPDVRRAFDDFIKDRSIIDFEYGGNKCRFSKPLAV